MKQQLIGRVPARSHLEVLRVLCSLSKDPKTYDQRPLVTLGLTNGQTVRGWLVDGDLDREGVVLVNPPDSNGYPGNSIVYVHSHDVRLLQIDNVESCISEVSFGAIDRAELIEPEGKLGLSRRLESVKGKLSEAVGKAIDVEVDWQGVDMDDPKHMGGVTLTVEALEQSIPDLVSDDFARREISVKVNKIVVRNAGKRRVAWTDGVLEIDLNLANGQTGRYGKADLLAALNKVL